MPLSRRDTAPPPIGYACDVLPGCNSSRAVQRDGSTMVAWGASQGRAPRCASNCYLLDCAFILGESTIMWRPHLVSKPRGLLATKEMSEPGLEWICDASVARTSVGEALRFLGGGSPVGSVDRPSAQPHLGLGKGRTPALKLRCLQIPIQNPSFAPERITVHFFCRISEVKAQWRVTHAGLSIA
jgi:hypothetical protein